MNKYIYILLIIIFAFKSNAHTDHYKGIKKIEMEIFRNNEVIGYSNYFFDKNDNEMIIKNYTKFNVELFGVSIFSILSESIEVYENDKLINFKSNTFQNKKEKYVKLNYDKLKNKFIINGSSYKGEASIKCEVGNWWNHKILKTDCQISPLSGSIKNQVVIFIGEEYINLYDKNYLAEHYKLKSKDENISEDKKLDFDIWFNKKNNLLLKVSYSKMGDWEYRLKNFE